VRGLSRPGLQKASNVNTRGAPPRRLDANRKRSRGMDAGDWYEIATRECNRAKKGTFASGPRISPGAKVASPVHGLVVASGLGAVGVRFPMGTKGSLQDTRATCSSGIFASTSDSATRAADAPAHPS
jgi:hypothetical protein